VLRSVRRLEVNGHLRIVWGQPGRGHPNQYWMVVKPAPMQVLEPGKPASEVGRKPAPVKIKPAPMQENLLKNLEGFSKENPSLGEREDQPSADLMVPPGAAAPDGAAPVDQNQELELSVVEISPQPLSEPNLPKEEGLPSAEQVERSEPKTNSERDARFEELRALWRRGHLADDTDKAIAIARAAYAKAIAEGARPEEIVEVAKQWIAAADAPRFLPALPNWLATHGWEHPPLQKTRTREAVRGNGAYRRKETPDLALAMVRAATR
jgi:hypothetical protein